MHVVALDYESYYSSTVSIKTMGAYHYLRHPEMDIYMLSIDAEGFQYVGRPEGFDYSTISGPDFTIISHNYSFETCVNDRLKELGVIPKSWKPAQEHCTADLCAFLGLPRDLAGAVKAVFGVDLSKNVRTNMKGKLPKDLSPTELEDLNEYALLDSIWCRKLWEKLSHLWPEWEREISRINREMGIRGIDVDYEKLEWAANHRLRKIMAGALRKLPWIDNRGVETIIETGDNPFGLQPLSKKAVAIECESLGIEPPESMAAASEEFEDWLEEHSPRVRWVNAMRAYRRANALREKILKIIERRMWNGRTTISFLYCGAGNTRRFSGTGGVNFQNLSRKPIFGVNLRNYILPCAAGTASEVFAPVDLSQIEARCLPWLAGDTETLELVRQGYHIYEVHARRQMGWEKGDLKAENPLLYALAKARVLALGFGAGHLKFLVMAKLYVKKAEYTEIFNKPVSQAQIDRYLEHWEYVYKRKDDESAAWSMFYGKWKKESEQKKRFRVNAWEQVNDFRENSPKVTAFWKRMDDVARAAAQSPERELRLELPSGNCLIYRKMRLSKDGVACVIIRNGRFVNAKLYGGLLTENLCQALARDIFCYGMLEADRQGYDLAMHTHDELVPRVPVDAAPERLENLIRIMSANPPWIPDMPIGAEGELCSFYKK